MPTSTSDKLFSEATIGDVEAMLTRVFSKAAMFAILQGEQERRADWCNHDLAHRAEDIEVRKEFCQNVIDTFIDPAKS